MWFGLAGFFLVCFSLLCAVQYVAEAYTTKLSAFTTGEALLVRLAGFVAMVCFIWLGFTMYL